MRTLTNTVAAAAVLLMILPGCRKDLCYEHDIHGFGVKVDVAAGWELVPFRDYGSGSEDSPYMEDLAPEPGDGITAIVYNEDNTRSDNHLDPEGGRLPMNEGVHDILLYNSDTEYIVFGSLDSYAEASASTRTRFRSTYQASHGEEKTVNPPDMLFSSWVQDYQASLTIEPVTLPVTMSPLVYTYRLIFEFEKGAEHIELARGAMAGMAGTVYLGDGRTGEETATLLFDETGISGNTVIADVHSFGIPSFDPETGTSETDGTYMLNLEIMLPNGRIKTFDNDVSDQMRTRPRGGVIRVQGLRIEDEEAGSGGGFDVDVGDWGEAEDIILPL